jgi:capsid protein
MQAAVLAGRVNAGAFDADPRAYLAAKWQPEGFQWVDPMKESIGWQTNVLAGHATQTEVLADRGRDFDEFLDEREAEVEAATARGLTFSTHPQAAPVAGSPPSSPVAGAAAPDPDDEDEAQPDDAEDDADAA